VGFLVGVLVGVDVGFFVGSAVVGVEVAGKVGIAGAAVGDGVVGLGVCAWSSRCCCNGADWDDDEEQLVDVQSS